VNAIFSLLVRGKKAWHAFGVPSHFLYSNADKIPDTDSISADAD